MTFLHEPMSSAESAADAAGGPSSYRVLSTLALGAFFLGLASALAIVTPVLWGVPLIGIVAAALAIRQTRSEEFSGSRLAHAGLWCSVFFLLFAITQFVVRDQMTTQRARKAAVAWLELVRMARLAEAHQCMLSPVQRLRREELIETHYQEDAESRAKLQSVFTRPAIKDFVDLGPQAEIRLSEADRITEGRMGQEFIFRCHYHPEHPDRFVLVAVHRRRYSDSGGFEWEVQPLDPKEVTKP